MKEEQGRVSLVDYDSVKLDIFARVNNEGPLREMESWRRAYQDIDFMEVDENFSGKEIDWEKRTMAERAFFVAYMRSPQGTVVFYDLTVDGSFVGAVVDDSEKIWWMWLDRCFSGEDLDEESLRTYLWYADDSLLARKFIYDIDVAGLLVENLKVMVSPL